MGSSAAAIKNKAQSSEQNYSGPTNLTEYLFADKYGEINQDINTVEINSIYMAYM